MTTIVTVNSSVSISVSAEDVRFDVTTISAIDSLITLTN
jgi:hypothetical protein